MIDPRRVLRALAEHWNLLEPLCERFDAGTLSLNELRAQLAAELADHEPVAITALLDSWIRLDILVPVAKSPNRFELNAQIHDFLAYLRQEHRLGLCLEIEAYLRHLERLAGYIQDAFLSRDGHDLARQLRLLDMRVRDVLKKLANDEQALVAVAERAKTSDRQIPLRQRYAEVLATWDEYVEPMAAMMDSGADGSFYPLLEEATRALEHAQEWLLAQGALYTLRQQVSLAALQARLLCRQGREVLKQCSDTLLPLREEMRRHNRLSSSISQLLGQVRKRGLARTFRAGDLPLWRAERPRRILVGDEVRGIMAEARDFQPVSLSFPDEVPAVVPEALQLVDGAALRAQLKACIPVSSLLDWLHQQHPQLHDATLLRLYHELINEPEWGFQQADESRKTELHQVRVIHYPHGVFEQ